MKGTPTGRKFLSNPHRHLQEGCLHSFKSLALALVKYPIDQPQANPPQVPQQYGSNIARDSHFFPAIVNSSLSNPSVRANRSLRTRAIQQHPFISRSLQEFALRQWISSPSQQPNKEQSNKAQQSEDQPFVTPSILSTPKNPFYDSMSSLSWLNFSKSGIAPTITSSF